MSFNQDKHYLECAGRALDQGRDHQAIRHLLSVLDRMVSNVGTCPDAPDDHPAPAAVAGKVEPIPLIKMCFPQVEIGGKQYPHVILGAGVTETINAAHAQAVAAAIAKEREEIAQEIKELKQLPAYSHQNAWWWARGDTILDAINIVLNRGTK